MKWKKKKGCLFLGSLILSAVLMAGCSGTGIRRQSSCSALCEELFSFPGGSADQVMAAAQDDSSGTDTDTEEQSGGLSQTIEDVYGDYFTESGLQNFYRSGFPLNVYYAAQEKECEISFETVRKSDDAGEQENTEKYEVESPCKRQHGPSGNRCGFEEGKDRLLLFCG